MKPSSFTYQKAHSLDDVFAALAAHGDAAKVIAGGQSLGPMMNMRLAQPGHLIDLNGIADLDFIRESGGWIEIGALVRHHDLARSEVAHRCCPVLARAVETIGHYAIRQRGTIGGSFAHADPAAQLPLVGVLLGAKIIVSSIRGQRQIAAADFVLYKNTGIIRLDGLVFSAGIQNVNVTYDAGYTDIPDDLQQAVVELVADRFRNKENQGVRSLAIGSYRVDYGDEELPSEIKGVLDGYRRTRVS